jgi:hypothetical protein
MDQGIKTVKNPPRPYQPKRQRRRIKLDRVNPQDLTKFATRFFCNDCSHFDSQGVKCTMGYVPQHTEKEQMALYNLTGHMAFCRFLEID